MPESTYGRLISGDKDIAGRDFDAFAGQKVDLRIVSGRKAPADEFEKTLGRAVSVTGPGTFFRRAARTLVFEPTEERGWWFERSDLPTDLPTKVSVRNVWTTARNIVLRSGSPHNYMRMVEHIIALKLGMNIDNLLIRVDSGDPPLFDRGSLDLVEAFEQAGASTLKTAVKYVTVRETVTVAGAKGGFLTFAPDDGGRSLSIDCAIDFKDAIGRQRVQFDLTREIFTEKAVARTNTTAAMKLYCETVGKLFADIRNLGYTSKNILIAGKRRYMNEPYLLHNGKSLEAVWHRAIMDLLAAVALIDSGRFVGRILSFKSGHALDVDAIRLLYKHKLLVPA